MSLLASSACGVAGDVAMDALRKYRDFVTRVVCCYSTDTASDGEGERELAELLPPAEGAQRSGSDGSDDDGDAPARARGAARGGGSSWRPALAGGGGTSSDERSTSSDSDAEAAAGAMMRAVVDGGVTREAADVSPAKDIVRRLRERPLRRTQALARALAGTQHAGESRRAQQPILVAGCDAAALARSCSSGAQHATLVAPGS